MKKLEKIYRLLSYCLIIIGLLFLIVIHFVGEPYPNYRTLISVYVKVYIWITIIFNCSYWIIRKRNKR